MEVSIIFLIFILVNCYLGALIVYYFDVYCLVYIDEVVDLGFYELVDDVLVTVVEWGDVIVGVFFGGFLEVRLLLGDCFDDW